jgi:sialic acid synthase SpsE
MYGSDARHSLKLNEFKDMDEGIHAIEIMPSTKVDKNAVASRMGEMKDVFQKSIVSVVEILKGTIITREMIGFKKPGTGIPASQVNKILGKQSKRNIVKNSLILNEDLV